MVDWKDFNVVILTLVLMQTGIIVLVLTNFGIINVKPAAAEKPRFQNTVAHISRPPSSPTIFAPPEQLYYY